jgi:hypothetical protein
MTKLPPIILPFVVWPVATPQERAALMTFWANVILAAVNRGLVRPEPTKLAAEPGLFLAWNKSARGSYWVRVRDTHIVVFKRADGQWSARVQRAGSRARYLDEIADIYPHYLLHAMELVFGKSRDLNNRKALIEFTEADYMQAEMRDPILVAARLEEDRDRANGFASYEAD